MNTSKLNQMKKLLNQEFKNLQNEWKKLHQTIERLNAFQSKMHNFKKQLTEFSSDSQLNKTELYQSLNQIFKKLETDIKQTLSNSFITKDYELKLLKTRQYFLADLENQRKMNAINQTSSNFEIKRKIFQEMLKIVDMFVLSLKFEAKNSETQKFLIGMKMVYDMLNDFLNKFDVRLLETKPGQSYDYNLHQALKQINNPKLKTNTIVTIEQNGYLINDQVLRQTKVVINNHDYKINQNSKNNMENMKNKEKKKHE